MLPLKHILCPIDFSVDSQTALKAAGEMAQYFSAHLNVLHVIEPTPINVYPHDGMVFTNLNEGTGSKEMLQSGRSELQSLTRRLISDVVNLSLEVVEGDPAQKILEVAHRDRADMVVIAPHGHGRLRKAIFGSTAERVVKDAPCPVVTLHAGQAGENHTDPAERQEKARG